MGDTYDYGEPDENEAERLTRNLNELLQELRVTQTGIQILTGFLLTLPFSQRFKDLDALQRGTFLAILTGSVGRSRGAWGKASSRYSQITVDSVMMWPS